MTFRYQYLPCLFAIFVLSGCGGDGRPSLVAASGKVTLNGEPIADATVGFMPQDIPDYKRPSSAQTDSSGMFMVGTYGADDGIPEGTYKVTVAKSEIVGKVPEGFNSEEPQANARPVKTRYIVPQMYSSPETSGLTVTVTAEGMDPAVIALEGDAEVGAAGAGANEP